MFVEFFGGKQNPLPFSGWKQQRRFVCLVMVIFATTIFIGGVTLPVLQMLGLTSSGHNYEDIPVYPGYIDEEDSCVTTFFVYTFP